MYGLILAASFFIIFILGLIKRKISQEKSNIIIFLALFTIGIVLGCFWYIKNWVQSGNPLGFVEIRLFGRILFNGTMLPDELKKSSLAGSFIWTNPGYYLVLIQQLITRLQAPFIIFTVLAFITLISPENYRKRNAGRSRFIFIWLAGLISIFIYWNTPFTSDADSEGHLTAWIGYAFRYGFSGLGIFAVLSAIGFKNIKIKNKWLVFGVIFCLVLAFLNFAILDTLKEAVGIDKKILMNVITRPQYFSIIYTMFKLLFPYLILTTFIIPFIFLFMKNRILNFHPVVFSVFSLTLFTVFIFISLRVRESNIGVYYGNPAEYLWKNIPEKETIGYIDFALPYPLFGKNLNNNIIELSDKHKLEDMLTEIRNKKIHYLAVGQPNKSNSFLYKSIEQDTEIFTRVSGEDPEKLNELEILQLAGYKIKCIYKINSAE